MHGFSNESLFTASSPRGQHAVRYKGKLWRGTNHLPVTFAERQSSNRTTGGWSRWGMCFALKKASPRDTLLCCPGIATSHEIPRSTIFAGRAALPRRWNDLCLQEISPLKDRSLARVQTPDDRGYMTMASFSSSAWMQSMDRPVSSKRATASRALCRDTP